MNDRKQRNLEYKPDEKYNQNQNKYDEVLDNISLPDSWSDWRLTGILGEGAYGKVYRAEDRFGHIAAIKIFRLPRDANVPETDLLPLIKDLPGIVRVEDYYIDESEGKSEGLLRMEYLTDLDCWQRNHPIDEEEAISLMMDLCDALTVCEQQGIIHRDIKPGNILITEEGNAKLGDFGVARIASPTDSDLSLAGTFRYMAPEIYHGNPYDRRADIYSLGMVFYELMNHGKIPFEEKGREKALKLRMDGAHFPKPGKGSKGFGDILDRACAYEPEARYQDAREIKADLVSLKEGNYRPGRTSVKRLSKKEVLTAAVMIIILSMVAAVGVRLNSPIVPREPCGYGVSWVLKRNGTLEISGEGMMDSPIYNLDYTDSHREMLAHANDVKKVKVKDNVRVVDLYGVPLPNLEEAEFSKSLERITGNSFVENPKLRSVIFHGEDVDLGEYVFSLCPKLSEVVLPSRLTKIPDGCFFQCESLSDLQIPDTVTEIGESAFTETAWYDNIYKARDFLVVGDHCLVFWKGQEEELSITKEMGIAHIGAGAFSESRLKSITMDDSVLTIDQRAFIGVPLERVVLPDHLVSIPDYAFTSCVNLKSITLPAMIKRIGRGAFRGCASLEELTIPGTLESVGWEAFEETPFKKNHTNKEGFTVMGSFLVDYQGNEVDLDIPDSLGIKRIGEYFMEQNQRLKSVTLPEGLEELEQNCFFLCQNLESVTFPRSLKTIGQGSFVDTLWWREQLKKDYIIVNDVLLYCCSEDSTIVIPENLPVTKIAGGAFRGQQLEEITIPSGIREIEEDAFDDCANLREVHLPDTWTEEEIRKCFYKTPWYYLRK